MPSLGWQELVIVLIIVVIIFGAGKLPEIGGAMGKSIKEFKKESEEVNAIGDGTSATSTNAGTVSQSVDSTQVRADEI
ncbi:MAG: twin-arginine translocase TatA/TatE family subunit [Thermomicrobiales bacterium]|nr:twin-arginine translocase TatA/TatE family subunit [Thermomicrobiales bacterium]MCO5221686.1 twin-arginine translocase TatA/TatE family subunit [Thermomicrobiales bacterium]